MLYCPHCGRTLSRPFKVVCECRLLPKPKPINDGGPAFPHGEKHGDGSHFHSYPGMSLRDWFAGQALAGIFAGGYRTKEIQDMASGTMGASTPAGACYALADAMLAERAKPK